MYLREITGLRVGTELAIRIAAMRLPYRLGQYTLVERIAAGGTAEVYKATFDAYEGFSKVVAVKRLLPSWGGDSDIEKMLVDEARALMHLQHQAIVQVFELGRSEGMLFLAMEFVDGIDCARLLTEVIRESRPVPLEHALYIIGQVLTALEFAHCSADSHGRALGIVHRDVSPSNIMLSWNGEVKVTDFGIAKGSHRSNDTAMGQIKGKYAYMAPEQAQGLGIDARADIFACGIVLYEMVSARRLFDAGTDVEVLEQVKRADLKHLIVGAFAPELAAILILALRRDPRDRYQSAAEMLSDVQRFARSSGQMSSSIEFAPYLKSLFPRALPPDAAVPLPRREEPKTAVDLLPPVRSRPRVAHALRVAGIVALIFCAAFIQPVRPAGHADAGVTRSVAADTAGDEKAPAVPPLTPPPAGGGAVVVASTPAGAKGTLTIAGEKRVITTPFSIDGIEIGDGVDGRIEIAAEGFESFAQAFKLTQGAPVFAKTIALRSADMAILSVQARPWGLVDVGGVASNREAPVNGLKLKAGSYSVTVRHPPSGKIASGRVSLAGGEAKRCLASFGERPTFSCR